MNETGAQLRAAALVALGAVIGVLAGRWLSSPSAPPARKATNIASVQQIEIVDGRGYRRAVIGMGGEGPGIWFYDGKGRVRLSLGLYGDDNASVVVNDPLERAVEIFRTVGEGAPVFVLKSEGRDRMIISLEGKNADPSLVAFDAQGNRKPLFGN